MIDKTYTVQFNDEYSAICLKYSLSNYLKNIAIILTNEFSSQGLIYDINSFYISSATIEEKQIILTHLKYALDFNIKHCLVLLLLIQH